MRRLLYACLVTVFAMSVCFGQLVFNQTLINTIPIQTGFAVVTPISSTGTGLSVSETFGEQVGGSLFQSSVLPSPLVTFTSVVVSTNVDLGANTGVALVNPTDTPATLTLTLLNGQGAQVSIRTITVGPRQQVSRFVTEVFAGVPEIETPFIGQLFISSSVPIGVLGLAFIGPSFTSLPVATQLSVDNSATFINPTVSQPITTVSQPIAVLNTTSTFTNTNVSQPTTVVVQPPSAFNTMTPLPSNIVGLPSAQSVTDNITTPLDTTVVATTGQFTTTVSPTSALVVTTTPTVALAVGTTTPTATFITFPQVTDGVGGTGASLLPQIALGGGWVSQIMIANSLNVAQSVRVDFFNPQGGPFVLPSGASTVTTTIPAGGTVSISIAP